MTHRWLAVAWQVCRPHPSTIAKWVRPFLSRQRQAGLGGEKLMQRGVHAVVDVHDAHVEAVALGEALARRREVAPVGLFRGPRLRHAVGTVRGGHVGGVWLPPRMLLCPCACVCPGPTGRRSCQPGTAGTASSCPTARGTLARRLARRRGPRRAEGSRSGRVPRCSFPACGNRPRTPCAAGAVLPQQVRPQAPPVVAAAAPQSNRASPRSPALTSAHCVSARRLE